jgi:hypothetical protein
MELNTQQKYDLHLLVDNGEINLIKDYLKKFK